MLLMPRASIMTEKLARRGLHVHQEYETDILQQVRVDEVMDKNPPTIPARMTIAELAERIGRHEPEVSRHAALLVMDGDDKLAAIITRGDVLRALDKEPSGTATVLEGGSSKVVVTYPDEMLSEAAHKILRNDIGRLPVVERADPRRVVGYLGRPNIMSARLRRLEEEHHRERGWITGSLLRR
jgi:CBS domain-containing protein